MNRRTIIAMGTVAALSVGGIIIATGGGSAQDPGQDSAVAAALEAVPGEVVEVEAEDDGSAGYEVEIKTADGTEVEVHVDLDGNVVGMDNGDDDGGSGDDD